MAEIARTAEAGPRSRPPPRATRRRRRRPSAPRPPSRTRRRRRARGGGAGDRRLHGVGADGAARLEARPAGSRSWPSRRPSEVRRKMTLLARRRLRSGSRAARSVEAMIRAGDRFLRRLAALRGARSSRSRAPHDRGRDEHRPDPDPGLIWISGRRRAGRALCRRAVGGASRRKRPGRDPEVVAVHRRRGRTGRRASGGASGRGRPSAPTGVARASTPGPAKTSGTTISLRERAPCPAAFPDRKPYAVRRREVDVGRPRRVEELGELDDEVGVLGPRRGLEPLRRA